MTDSRDRTIPQTRQGTNVSPVPGEPFDFSKILGGVLIPPVILRHPYLCPGARLLWGVIRARSHKQGFCGATDASLAMRLNVSERQIRRYMRQLVKTGLVGVVPRPGDPPERRTLWHAIFAGAAYPTPDINVLPPGHISPPPRTETSADKRSSEVVSGRSVFNLGTSVENGGPWFRQMRSAAEVAAGIPIPETAVAEPAPATPELPQKGGKQSKDQDAVTRQIRAFGIEPTRTLLLRLQSKADFWHATDYQVAAALARVLKRVQRSPSSAPHTERWFLTVVENELKGQRGH